MKKSHFKLSVILLAVIIPLLWLFFFKEPMTQNLAYHNFADQRNWVGINNFMDVMSNLGFIWVGIIGLKNAQKLNQYKLSWVVFYIGVLLVAPGSAYYHLWPNNDTLVWDRLPMTIGFMGIFTAIMAETFKLKKEKTILFSLIALGIYSVIHWVVFDDLRLYFWVQLTPLLSILLIALMYNSESIKGFYLLGTFTFYMLAKLTEKYDTQIFSATFEGVSGHSLKHLLAAIAIYFLYAMKKKTLKAY